MAWSSTRDMAATEGTWIVERVRTDGVTWREVGDEIVVLHLNTSRYLSLNGTGALLWRRLADGGAEREELVDLLLATFEDVDKPTAASDVDTFLADCQEYDVLEKGARGR